MHLQKVSTNSAPIFVFFESRFALRRTSGFLFFKVDVRFHCEALSTKIQNKNNNIKCLVNTKYPICCDLVIFPKGGCCPLPVMIFSSVNKTPLMGFFLGVTYPPKMTHLFSANHLHCRSITPGGGQAQSGASAGLQWAALPLGQSCAGKWGKFLFL